VTDPEQAQIDEDVELTALTDLAPSTWIEVDPNSPPRYPVYVEFPRHLTLNAQMGLSAAATVFHLPGQHNQETHGTGVGVSGHDALDATKISIGSDDGKVRGGYLRPEETSALTSYRNTGYVRINDHLRGKTPINPDDVGDAAMKAAAIKEAMAKSPLKQKITVTRGTRNDHWLPPGLQDGKGDATGAVWQDRGFVSVSARTDRAQSFAGRGGVAMRITVPEGTRAIGLSDFTDEAEILLDSSLSFQVTHDHGMIDGIRHLDVEVIG
jgi:hypothetical protein